MKLALAAAFALEAASTVHAIAVGTIDPAKKMKRSHFENLVKRQSFTTGNASDSTVLSNALVLQHLEANFYTEGLAKFDQTASTRQGTTTSVRFLSRSPRTRRSTSISSRPHSRQPISRRCKRATTPVRLVDRSNSTRL